MAKKLPLASQKRMRYDKLLILIALFGVVGSVVVFRSYADRRIDTSKAGAYPTQQLVTAASKNSFSTTHGSGGDLMQMLTGSTTQLLLKTSAGKQYCVTGYSRAGASLGLTFGSISKQFSLTQDYPVEPANPPIILGCILAPATSNDSLLIIATTGNVWLQNLVVQ